MKALAVAALLHLGAAQLGQRCSNYQTTTNFTQNFFDKMRARTGGYIVRFSNGATDGCQRLQFVDGNDFNVSFIDVANHDRNYTDRYSIATSSPVHPAKLHLSMYPRLLGADIQGNLVLHPLVARDDVVAFVSCIERGLGLFITEQVLVYTPYAEKKTLSDDKIKQILKENQVPRMDELKNISQNCTPQPSRSSSPLPLNLYNLISNFQNPFGGVSGVALTYGSPDQNPAVVAQELMGIFREAGISPAQFYATTGSTVLQNQNRPIIPQQNVPQMAFDALSNMAALNRHQQGIYSLNRQQSFQQYLNGPQPSHSKFNLHNYATKYQHQQPQQHGFRQSGVASQFTPTLSAAQPTQLFDGLWVDVQ